MIIQPQPARGRGLFRPLLWTLVLALLVTLPAVGARGKKSPSSSKEKSNGKSLSDTVGDAEKIEGLVTFYRSPEKLYLELPARGSGALRKDIEDELSAIHDRDAHVPLDRLGLRRGEIA